MFVFELRVNIAIGLFAQVVLYFKEYEKVEGGVVASWLERSGFEPWPGTLRCVLRQDTLLSPCLSPHRCINGYEKVGN